MAASEAGRSREAPRRRVATLAFGLAIAATACGSTPRATGDRGGAGGAATGAAGAGVGVGGGGGVGIDDDPDPVFTSLDLQSLRALRYDASPAPADASSRIADDPRAQALGQRLFFETAFSGPLLDPDNDGTIATLGTRGQSGAVSCAGCHIPASGFVDTRSPHRQISLAAGWSRRRTPTLLDVAFAPLIGWDGRRDSIWGQSIGVMENEREFNSGRLFVAEQMFRLYRPDYEALFGPMPAFDDAARFPQLAPGDAGCDPGRGGPTVCRGLPGDGGDFDGLTAADQAAVTRVVVDTAKAIAAYVRALRCGAARFDAWLDGDAPPLSRAEQRGAALFVGRAGCTSCHGGPTLSDQTFHNVGLAPKIVAVAFTDVDDHGARDGMSALLTDPLNTGGAFSDGDPMRLPAAAAVTGNPALDGAFRTPSLRCIASHPSFMHTAQLTTLDAVVAFFGRGGDPTGYPGHNELVPLGLSTREQADLVAFLKALEGPGPASALRAAPMTTTSGPVR